MHDKCKLIGVIDEGTKAARFVVSFFFSLLHYFFLQFFPVNSFWSLYVCTRNEQINNKSFWIYAICCERWTWTTRKSRVLFLFLKRKSTIFPWCFMSMMQFGVFFSQHLQVIVLVIYDSLLSIAHHYLRDESDCLFSFFNIIERRWLSWSTFPIRPWLNRVWILPWFLSLLLLQCCLCWSVSIVLKSYSCIEIVNMKYKIFLNILNFMVRGKQNKK